MKRTYVVFAAFVLIAICIVAKIVSIQYGKHGYWKKMAEDMTLDSVRVEAERGNIYTFDGRMLATTIPSFELRMDTKADGITDTIWNKNISRIGHLLSSVIEDKSAEEWITSLNQAKKNGERYFLLGRKLSFQQYKMIKSDSFFMKSQYKSGLMTIQCNTRKMPFGYLAQRTIGYVRDSGDNKRGIEGAYNDELSGENKVMQMQKVAGGVYMPVGEQSQLGAKPGLDIYTNIDINLQDVAENSLLKTLTRFKADHGSTILMNVKTGEIKAIANLTRNKDGNYFEGFNYAINELNEPGSVMKLASVMALLEDGFCDETYKIDLEKGSKKYYDREMHDAHKIDATVSLEEAFQRSSNVGISKPVFKFYNEDKNKFYEKLVQFHLTTPLGIDIQGESAPKVASPKKWSGISLPWISIGYEVKFTPLQLLGLYAAVANNGVLMKPYIVKEIRENDKVVESFKPIVLNKQICKQETAAKVRKMLEKVVDSGTASNIRNNFYKIAGKTGTNLISYGSKGYQKGAYQASFVGYFPANNPLYACIVVVNKPDVSISYYGNAVAAPVFRDIADRLYSSEIEIHPSLDQLSQNRFELKAFKGLRKEVKRVAEKFNWSIVEATNNSDWAFASVANQKMVVKPVFFNSHIMPNVKQMNLKDAVYILEAMGAKVRCIGKGKVRSQSVEPGVKIYKGTQIVIELES